METLSKERLESALAPVAADLERVEAIILEASSSRAGFLTETATYLAKAGGKRLRPALAALAARCGSGPGADLDRAAAALEMTHLATLYHDDVIDEGDLRHGLQSVNSRWGNHVAILAGDYLLARSSALASEVGGEVPGILANAVARVIEGQLSELNVVHDAGRTVDAYFGTIEGKTGALLEASTWVGALLGRIGEDGVASLREYGAHFGLAYQIADDLLDLSAEAGELGKPPGADLRQGVYTLPVLYALEADPAMGARLSGGDVDIDSVRRAVFESGGFERALAEAWNRAESAKTALVRVGGGEARASLLELVRIVVDRVPDPGSVRR